MSRSTPISGPHTHAPLSIRQIMLTVMLALLPGTAYGIYQFGWPALNIFLLTIVSAWLVEALCLYLGKRPMRAGLLDGSGVLTAWLLALSLPPYAPWWIAVLGGACAIVLGKQVFGGLGQNLFNPAMLARVILLISFPVQMTTWVAPQPMFSPQDPGFSAGLQVTFDNSSVNWDSVSTASPLGHLKTELTLKRDINEILSEVPAAKDSAFGITSGSLGETSALLLLLGGIWLVMRRIITWHAPLAMLTTVLVIAAVFHQSNPTLFPPPSFHLLNGGMILAAFFIITDPVTSPNTAKGQMLFGIGCGALVFIIRSWGSYPEAVAFAVLLMNAFTPLIDHYLRPRIYGRTRSGAPLPVAEKAKEEQS